MEEPVAGSLCPKYVKFSWEMLFKADRNKLLANNEK